MYIIRNALRNIMRSKGRNILIGVIVLVIATSSCVALSIQQAADTAKEEGLQDLSITGQITEDRQSMMEMFKNGGGGDKSSIRDKFSAVSELTLDELENYAKSQYVSDFYYSITSSVNSGSDAFEPYETSSKASSTDTDAQSNMPWMPSGGKGGSPFGGMGTQGDFSIIGYGSESAMTDFISGVCAMTQGSMVDLTASDNTCLITDVLAALNDIEVGDTITIANPNQEEEVYTLTVVGIYSNSSSSSGVMQFSSSNDPANKIITSVGTLNSLVDSSEASAQTETDETTGMTSTTALRSQLSGIYSFADVASYEAFQTDVVSMGLSDSYTVTSTDISAYEASLTPLKNLSSFARIFLIIVLLIGGIILMVLNIFNIHERKYEVGVLTAIGMKKSKVAIQYVAEVFTVTIVCIMIGAVVGAVASVPVTNTLLESQISSQQSKAQQIDRNFGRDMNTDTMDNGNMPVPPSGSGFGDFMSMAGASVTDYVSSISSATNFTVILELLGIGVLLTILSSVAAVVIILRYEPLKILTSRT